MGRFHFIDQENTKTEKITFLSINLSFLLVSK